MGYHVTYVVRAPFALAHVIAPEPADFKRLLISAKLQETPPALLLLRKVTAHFWCSCLEKARGRCCCQVTCIWRETICDESIGPSRLLSPGHWMKKERNDFKPFDDDGDEVFADVGNARVSAQLCTGEEQSAGSHTHPRWFTAVQAPSLRNPPEAATARNNRRIFWRERTSPSWKEAMNPSAGNTCRELQQNDCVTRRAYGHDRLTLAASKVQ